MVSTGFGSRRCAFPCVLALALPWAAGCGSGPYPVEGKVVWADGKPAAELAGGTVIFESAETQMSATGEIQKDGSFKLSTSKQDDGAFPGKYKVAVTAPEPENVPDDAKVVRKRKAILEPMVQRTQTSPLEVTVEAKTNAVTLTVERAKN